MSRGLASRRNALAVTALGAGLGLVAATRPWATGVGSSALGPTGTPLAVSGSEVAPAYGPAVLIAIAGVVAAAVVGPRLRPVAAGLAALGALGALVLTATAPSGAAAALAARTVPPGGSVSHTALSAGFAAGVAGALLALAGTALALLGMGAWGRGTGRYDSPVAGGASAPGAGGDPHGTAAPPVSDWDALSRGDDPTL